MKRQRLPNRRHSIAFLFEFESHRYRATASRFADGRLAEIFLDTDKAGTPLQLNAETAAILASLCLQHDVDLAAHTGLRLGDLLRLSWSHIGENEITITTGKSKHRRTAIIPLYDDLREVLASIPKRATTILTNVRRRPWTANGFGTAFNRAKIAAGMNDRDLHFHDLRGTAVTKFYIIGIPERVIAEIMAWEEDHVAKIIRRYVDRAAATKELIRQINEKGT